MMSPSIVPSIRARGKALSALWTSWLLVLFSVLALTGTPASLHAKGANQLVIKQYNLARAYYNNVLENSALAQSPKNWQQAADYFHRSYKTDPYHPKAPACLLTLGHLKYKMYKKFSRKEDLADALAYYDDLFTLFPQHRYADDALYMSGTIAVREQKDFQAAALIFARLLAVYPGGDMIKKAAKDLKKVKQHKPKAPKKTTVEVADQGLWTPPEKPTGAIVDVIQFRHWSTKSYTRVVIETTGPVSYEDNLLKPSPGSSIRRLYINLKNCRISKKTQQTIPINDGLLKQVRSAQYRMDTVRVVLDMHSLLRYNIFSLNNPFRIVIDVKGRSATGSPLKHKNLHNAPSLAQQLGLGIRKIIIDPGHGGKDPGALGINGLREKDIVLKVAKRLARKIEEDLGINAILTRNRDIFIPLEERTAIANTKEGDLFVSIHANSAPNKKAHGVETYYLAMASNKEEMRVAAQENQTARKSISDMEEILKIMQDSKIEESARLAKIVQTNMVTELSSKYGAVGNHGIKKAPFIVLIGAQMPAILTEIAFMSHAQEADRLKSDDYLNDIANAIAAGVITYAQGLKTAGL